MEETPTVKQPEGSKSDVIEPEVIPPKKEKEKKKKKKGTGKADRSGKKIDPKKTLANDMGRFSVAEKGKRDEMRWSRNNKFIYHYDKRTMILMEEDGYPDPIDCFDKRDDLFPKVISEEGLEEERAQLGLDYINFLASGGRTRKFLREKKVIWSYINFILRKSDYLWLMYRGAMAIGEELRQQVREDEADRRAVDGTKKPVYQQKELVGYITEYSDSLLLAQLKAGNPDKYADRQKVEHQGVVLNLSVPNLRQKTQEEDQ